jgi:hypothetical protein
MWSDGYLISLTVHDFSLSKTWPSENSQRSWKQLVDLMMYVDNQQTIGTLKKWFNQDSTWITYFLFFTGILCVNNETLS